MYKKIFVATAVTSLMFSNCVFAAANFSYKQAPAQTNSYVQQPLQYPQSGNTLRGNVIMVPAGSTINTVVTAPLSSATTTAGEAVSFALNSDYYYDGKLIAPAGSTVYGTVIEASKAKHGSMNGKLCIRFNQIYTPYGTQIPISAVIRTDDKSGVLVGGTKMDVTKEYAKDLVAGSAAGALSGLVVGAIAGGNIGRATAITTAIGAGGGLAKSVWNKGEDVTIPSGATIELMLTQPITVNSPVYSYEN